MISIRQAACATHHLDGVKPFGDCEEGEGKGRKKDGASLQDDMLIRCSDSSQPNFCATRPSVPFLSLCLLHDPSTIPDNVAARTGSRDAFH